MSSSTCSPSPSSSASLSIHKPHKPKEFVIGGPNTHYEKFLERIRDAKRKVGHFLVREEAECL